MSKIDEYKRAVGQLQAFEAFMDTARHPRTDKFGVSVVLIESYVGSYGSSNCSSWPDFVLLLTARDMQKHLFASFERSRAVLKTAVENARIAAQDEAKEVLREVVP